MLLASILTLLGVVPAPSSASSAQPWASPPAQAAAAGQPPLARGELLCQAFEAFRWLQPQAQISFEHAVFLVSALGRGDQLRLACCEGCGSVMVSERFPLRAARCAYCAGAPHTRC